MESLPEQVAAVKLSIEQLDLSIQDEQSSIAELNKSIRETNAEIEALRVQRTDAVQRFGTLDAQLRQHRLLKELHTSRKEKEATEHLKMRVCTQRRSYYICILASRFPSLHHARYPLRDRRSCVLSLYYQEASDILQQKFRQEMIAFVEASKAHQASYSCSAMEEIVSQCWKEHDKQEVRQATARRKLQEYLQGLQGFEAILETNRFKLLEGMNAVEGTGITA
jgi:hypothetical protein